MIVQCDDRLQVIAEKTCTDGTGKKLNLARAWKDATEYARDDEGNVIIYQYWNGSKNSPAYLNPKEYAKLESDKNKWIPCFEYTVPTGIENTQGRTRDNHVYFQILKLSTGDEAKVLSSRYKDMVEVLDAVRPRFLDYQSRGGDERARYESSRNVLLRSFRLHEYEYNVFFPIDEQGKAIYSELKQYTKPFEEGGTLYLKGYDAKQKATGASTVKLYDAGRVHGFGRSMMKLEVTLRAKAFKAAGVTIQNMTLQENCIAILRTEIMAQVMKLQGGQELRKMQMELFSNDNILARMIRAEGRLDRHDDEIASMKKQLAALQKAMKADRQEIAQEV